MAALDPQLRTLLTSLRRRVRRYIVADSFLALVAVVLSAFWIGLLIDFLPVRLGGTEMPRSARAVLLVVVGSVLVAMIARLLIGRLRRPLPNDSLALLVERHHPQLGGRLITAVQLQQAGREGDSHSPAMLARVHAEAAQAVGGFDANRVFRWQPLIRKVSVVLPLALATLVLAAASPSAFGRAAGRLLLLSDEAWPRRAELRMVGVELPVVSVDESESPPPTLIPFEDRRLRLPRGSSSTLRIAALAEGAEVPEVCTVHFTTDTGTRGQANMRRVGRVTDGYQGFVLEGPPLAGLSESVTISVRGLDARLDDFRIEAVPPPALTRVQVATIDPSYLRQSGAADAATASGEAASRGEAGSAAVTRQVDYQAGLRVREGAQTRLIARASAPLERVDARMLVGNAAVSTPAVTLSEDGREFSLEIEALRQPATLIVVPQGRDGISAQVPYRYFLGVVMDEKPEIEMRLRGIGSAVTPQARLPIWGRARDDYGLDEALISLSSAPAEAAVAATDEHGEPLAAPEAAPQRSLQTPIHPDREGAFEVTLDLREIAESKTAGIKIPEPGGAINLIGGVSDHYNLDGQRHHTTSQLYRLEIVTPENLLALLERRELALRARLEQTIEETRGLRDALVNLAPELDALPAAAEADGETGGERETQNPADADEAASEPARQRQVLRLRTQQVGLQATKTSEELQGIATALDDLLEEMANNRIDSIDRSERIGSGVRDPLQQIVAGDLAKLREQITAVERRIAAMGSEPAATSPPPSELAGQAVQTAEQVILQLTAVLEKMLDLESYNEILDMVRELIEAQEGLIEETEKARRRSVLDLFD